jgi:hypothetical protein
MRYLLLISFLISFFTLAENNKVSLERRALEYILSDSFKNKWYLSESNTGSLVDENNKAVFKPATVDALKKALRYL